MIKAIALHIIIAIFCVESEAEARTLCNRSFDNPANLLKNLAQEGVVAISNDAQSLRMADKANNIVWTFNKISSPAPAVVCQRIYKEGDQIQMQMEIACSGPQQACDSLKVAYVKQTASIAEGIRAKHDKRQ